jgi:hypothetical protein
MRTPGFARILLVFCLLPAFLAWGQAPSTAAPAAPAAASPAQMSVSELSALVEKQFGSGFEIVTEPPMSKIGGAKPLNDPPEHNTWTPLLTGDFDGDGVEDAVIIARNKNALIGSDAYHYKVSDPYDDHFGYGTPTVTMDFNAHDPVHNLDLLIIHGSGKDGWRAETPKAKFVIINVPFELVSVARATLKKKAVNAIRVEESDTISSLIFWDGKKYRYTPGGGTL